MIEKMILGVESSNNPRKSKMMSTLKLNNSFHSTTTDYHKWKVSSLSSLSSALSSSTLSSTSSVSSSSSFPLLSHQSFHITKFLWLFLWWFMLCVQPVQSMGTLLHAGPTCFIQPNIHRNNNGQQQRSQALVDGVTSSPSSSNNNNNNPTATSNSNGSFKHRGICYSTLLCKQKGGVAIGKCGLGNACCVFPQSCDSISVRNSTYFTNPDYPVPVNRTSSMLDDHLTSNKIPLSPEDEESQNTASAAAANNKILHQFCSLIIHRMPGIHPICQLRLDFIEYDIEGPDGKWISLDDLDESGGQNSAVNNEILYHERRDYCQTDLITLRAMHTEEDIVPPICPRTVGQHVTIDIRRHIGPFILNINTIPNLYQFPNGSDHRPQQPNWNGRRRWNILINQIECGWDSTGAGGESASRTGTLLRNLLRNRKSPSAS